MRVDDGHAHGADLRCDQRQLRETREYELRALLHQVHAGLLQQLERAAAAVAAHEAIFAVHGFRHPVQPVAGSGIEDLYFLRRKIALEQELLAYGRRGQHTNAPDG